MSHYGILAIRKKDNKISLEDAMAPYDENAEVEPYIRSTYEELVEEGKQSILSWKCDERIKELMEGISKEDWIRMHAADRTTDSSKETYYNTIKEIADFCKEESTGKWTDKDYHAFITRGEEDHLDKDGNMLSSYNENAKWDWWVEGGRWSDELILKKSAQEKYGGAEKVDSAKVGDIDWRKMYSLSPERKKHCIEFWNYYVMGEPYPGTTEEFREKYATYYKPEYFKEKYKTIDNYITAMSTWRLHAVLDNEGEWHEVGQMGWFGMSSETTEEENDWESTFFDRFIKPLDDEDEITVIDCHI